MIPLAAAVATPTLFRKEIDAKLKSIINIINAKLDFKDLDLSSDTFSQRQRSDYYRVDSFAKDTPANVI